MYEITLSAALRYSQVYSSPPLQGSEHHTLTIVVLKPSIGLFSCWQYLFQQGSNKVAPSFQVLCILFRIK